MYAVRGLCVAPFSCVTLQTGPFSVELIVLFISNDKFYYASRGVFSELEFVCSRTGSLEVWRGECVEVGSASVDSLIMDHSVL